jgi:hypothetical protein
MKNVLKNKQEEGKVAKTIESVTSKFPSDLFLWSAIGAMVASAALQLTDRKHMGLFFGQWVAPILLMGVYNKIVKQKGHDIHKEEVEEPSFLKNVHSQPEYVDL